MRQTISLSFSDGGGKTNGDGTGNSGNDDNIENTTVVTLGGDTGKSVAPMFWLFAIFGCILFTHKGYKEQPHMKTEYKITTIGTPNICNLSDMEKKLFYSTLIEAITDHYKKESAVKNNVPQAKLSNNDS